MIIPNATIASRTRLCYWLRAALLMSIVAFSGCSLERSTEQSAQTPEQPQKVSTTAAKPVYKEVGEASWYGPGFQGNQTANGETFNQNKLTAAHGKLPLGTKAEVTNLENGKKVEVKINDRGPYAKGRAIDLSRAAAKKLDMEEESAAKVKIEVKPHQQKSAGNAGDQPG